MANGDGDIIESYQGIFRKQFCKSIAAREGFWKSAALDRPETKWYFDVHISKLDSLKAHIPGIAREAATFVKKVDEAHYDDELNELDQALAQRERNLGKMLVAMIVENWRFVRLARAKGRVADLENALSLGKFFRLNLSISQLANKKGYLDLPDKFDSANYSSAIAKDLSSAIYDSFKNTRQVVPKLLVIFYMRYLLDTFRRYRLRLFISVGVLGIGMEFVIYYNEYRPYYEASILICIGAVCAAAFERVFKHRWLAIHRTAVRQAAIALYISFCNAALERIPLDVMHELSDPKRLRELQSGHLSQDE